MEQAAASTLTGLFAQLGIAGFILAILITGAVWYIKASRDLRTERRDSVEILEARVEARDATIKDKDATIAERDATIIERNREIDTLRRQLLECQFSNTGGGVSNEPS